MKISELVASKDKELILLGLRSLSQEFYDWAVRSSFEIVPGIFFSCKEYSNRILEILDSEECYIDNLGQPTIYYRFNGRLKVSSKKTLISLIRSFENEQKNN